jgi:hypothetical protein
VAAQLPSGVKVAPLLYPTFIERTCCSLHDTKKTPSFGSFIIVHLLLVILVPPSTVNFIVDVGMAQIFASGNAVANHLLDFFHFWEAPLNCSIKQNLAIQLDGLIPK